MNEKYQRRVLFHTFESVCRTVEKKIAPHMESSLIVQKCWARIVENFLQQYKLKVTFSGFDKRRGILFVRVADTVLKGALQPMERQLRGKLSEGCAGMKINKICFSIR